MCEMRRVVLRRDHPGRRFQRRFGVAVVADNLARAGRGLFHLLAERCGIVVLVRSVVPDHFQFVAAHDRAAGVARDHRNAAHRHELGRPGEALHLHHLLHAVLGAVASNEASLPPTTGGRAITANFMPDLGAMP
jgi:hypothetical protein